MGKDILIVGIGGSGCSVADKLAGRLHAAGRGDTIGALAFDTDKTALASLRHMTTFPMVDDDSLGAVVERLGQERLARFFPCDWEKDHTGFLKRLEMDRGTGQWRSKALLSLVNFLSVPNAHSRLLTALAPFTGESEDGDLTMIVIASLAGGTGSGLLLPLTLYLRRLLGGRGRAIAMLACPDIYDAAVSAEQRVKMAANAYAALRELNAIDQVTRDTRPAAQQTNYPLAAVRLDDGMHMGCLFDTLSKDEPVIPAAPFDRVYLQDKLPNTTLVSMHEDVMVSLLYPICCDIQDRDTASVDLTAPASAHVWGGLSMLEFRYPREAVVRYIKEKNMFDTAQREWLPLVERAEADARDRIVQQRAYGRRLSNDSALFAEMMREVVDTYINNDETTREEDCPSRMETALGDVTVSVSDRLMADYFPSDKGTALRALIRECEETGLFLTGAPWKRWKQKRALVGCWTQTATEALELLRGYYADAITVLREEQETFAERISAADGALIALYRSYEHPALGLWALCALRNELATSCAGVYRWSKEMLTVDTLDELTEERCYLRAAREAKTRYGRAGGHRFWSLAKGDGSVKLSAKSVDHELLCEDMTALANWVERLVTEQLRFVMLEQLDGMIARLREAMRAVKDRMEDRELDVRLALNAGCTEGHLRVNVGVSPEQKQAMQQTYWNEHYLADGEEKRLSAQLAEHLASLLVPVKSADETAADGSAAPAEDGIAAVLQAITEGYGALVRAHLAPAATDPTALERALAFGVVGDTDGAMTEEGQALMRRALHLAPAPLHQREAEPTDTQVGVRIVNTLKVSERAAAYVLRHAETWGIHAETPEQAVQGLLYLLGEFETGVRICSELSDDTVTVTRTLQDLPLYMVTPFNEMERDGVYYQAYRKAIGMMRREMTQMWNPHLCRGMERHGALTYISPEMQRKRQNMVAKAMLYALTSGELFIAQEKTTGKPIYHYIEDVAAEPILLGDKTIEANDLVRLLSWIREDESRMEAWSEEYDSALSQVCRSLPALGLDASGTDKVKAALTRSHLLRALRENVFAQSRPPEGTPVMNVIALAYAISLAEGENGRGDGVRVLEQGYETLCTACRYRTESTGTAKDTTDYIDVYSHVLTAVMEVLVASGNESAIRWANRNGLFLRYRGLTERCPYLDGEE